MADRAETIAKAVAPHLRPGEILLEIGAGSGRVARALTRAVDLDIRLVDVVDYNETELELQLADATCLAYPDGSFDSSLLVFVLHHAPDPLSVLSEALRVSRRGVFVVENHVAGSVRRPLTRLIDSIPHWQDGVPVCYRTWTLEEWQQLFQRLPARVELLGWFDLGFFWRNFIARLEPLPKG